MRTDYYRALPLHSQVEILVDPWGIPHIYAGNDEDAFFAQGFNAARDRLWQLDLWRRQGLGLLSEVLGAGYLERDRAARLFIYRGPMDQEWAAYGCDLKTVIEPFVSGINEYIRLTARQPELLPAEFGALSYEPAQWQPEDLLRIRAHGRYRNAASEVQRAMILRELGPEADALRMRLEPATELAIAPGLDLGLITPDILRDYDLATSPVDLAGTNSEPPVAGSNNWVVSGARTATGRPILASDPHRALSVPSLRYLAHVSSPGFDVIGGGEPILPGISIGHNGRIAFGLTIFPADQEDLYVYQTDPATGTSYRYGDGWEPLDIVSEVIGVRGADPVSVVLKFTRHGPVLHEDQGNTAAFAIRAAWLETGMAPYLASIALMRTGDWPSFRAAAASWKSPGENLVYADTEDNIGWQPAALIPVRPNWNGLLPVPGDGRYEWDGFLAAPDLPAELNPPRGWIATANQRNVDASQISGIEPGFEWETPFRFQRICEVLQAAHATTVGDSAKLQNDYVSLPARQLTSLLGGLGCSDALADRAVKLLTGWDCALGPESTAAALFEVWLRSHLRPALLARALAGTVPPQDLARALDLLTSPANRTADARIDLDLLNQLPAQAADVAAMLEQSLADAMRELEATLGPDPATWTWGALHTASLVHPLTQAGCLPSTDPLARLGPQPRGGGGDTVGAASYGVASFTQNSGASLRMVLDVGAWDNSVAMNSPGQSGDPASPHYADLYAAWARGENIPLLYSRERIEAVAEHRLVLQP
jgi:penicillin amidase